jgi:ElaB/YqjD/DUF883 family membrane-anchored ribosome-binding protein
MPAASEAAEKLKDARKAEVQTGSHPAAEAERRKVKEEQEAEFHTPATAMLDSLQPFNVEGGEGLIHQMKARQARTAASEAVKDAGRHLLNVADPRPLIREHPWMAIGGSAALGFVAAMMLVPTEKSRAASRLRALERALEAESRKGERVSKTGSGNLGRILRLGVRLVQPMVLSLLTGAISGAATGAATGSEAGAESGNQAAGRGPEPGMDPPIPDVT